MKTQDERYTQYFKTILTFIYDSKEACEVPHRFLELKDDAPEDLRSIIKEIYIKLNCHEKSSWLLDTIHEAFEDLEMFSMKDIEIVLHKDVDAVDVWLQEGCAIDFMTAVDWDGTVDNRGYQEEKLYEARILSKKAVYKLVNDFLKTE